MSYMEQCSNSIHMIFYYVHETKQKKMKCLNKKNECNANTNHLFLYAVLSFWQRVSSFRIDLNSVSCYFRYNEYQRAYMLSSFEWMVKNLFSKKIYVVVAVAVAIAVAFFCSRREYYFAAFFLCYLFHFIYYSKSKYLFKWNWLR